MFTLYIKITFFYFSGDIVTHINNTPIHGSRDVYKFLENPDARTLSMVVIRKSKMLKVIVQPEQGDL